MRIPRCDFSSLNSAEQNAVACGTLQKSNQKVEKLFASTKRGLRIFGGRFFSGGLGGENERGEGTEAGCALACFERVVWFGHHLPASKAILGLLRVSKEIRTARASVDFARVILLGCRLDIMPFKEWSTLVSPVVSVRGGPH
jgi:hypothetical protein